MKPLASGLSEWRNSLGAGAQSDRQIPQVQNLGVSPRRTRFSQVEEWWLDVVTDSKAVHVLTILAVHANPKGVCWPSRKLIAGKVGCSLATVTAKTRLLEERGILTIEQRRRQSAIYTLNRADPRSQYGATSYLAKKSRRMSQEVNADSVKESSAVDREQTKEHTHIEQGRSNETETDEERHRRDCERSRLLLEMAMRIADGPGD
jgi:DNA-binding transcriptional MocR family regulator